MPDQPRGYARFRRAVVALAERDGRPAPTDTETRRDWQDMDPGLASTWAKLDDIADQRVALGLDQPAKEVDQ